MKIAPVITRFTSAGGNPNLGEQATEESKEAIANALRDSDLVFITAGMGGGTGSDAAPVVAQISKEALSNCWLSPIHSAPKDTSAL